MATFRSSFGDVSARATTGATMPVLDLASLVPLADLSTSGTSGIVQASGGGDWVAPRDGFVRVISDGAVKVASGSTPTAGSTSGAYVPANVAESFSVLAGHKVAVIDA